MMTAGIPKVVQSLAEGVRVEGAGAGGGASGHLAGKLKATDRSGRLRTRWCLASASRSGGRGVVTMVGAIDVGGCGGGRGRK